jgi:hypothetical protein
MDCFSELAKLLSIGTAIIVVEYESEEPPYYPGHALIVAVPSKLQNTVVDSAELYRYLRAVRYSTIGMYIMFSVQHWLETMH